MGDGGGGRGGVVLGALGAWDDETAKNIARGAKKIAKKIKKKLSPDDPNPSVKPAPTQEELRQSAQKAVGKIKVAKSTAYQEIETAPTERQEVVDETAQEGAVGGTEEEQQRKKAPRFPDEANDLRPGNKRKPKPEVLDDATVEKAQIEAEQIPKPRKRSESRPPEFSPDPEAWKKNLPKISWEIEKTAENILNKGKTRALTEWDNYLTPIKVLDELVGKNKDWINSARAAQASGGGKTLTAIKHVEIALQDTAATGVNLRDVSEYMVNKRMLDIAKKEVGHLIDTQASAKMIDEVMNKYSPEQQQSIMKASKVITDEYTKALWNAVDAGMISPDLAMHLIQTEPNYFQIVREFADSGEFPVKGATGTNVIKKLVNPTSRRKIIDPLVTFNQTIMRSYEMADQNLWKARMAEDMLSDPAMAEFISTELASNGKNQWTYKLNGESKTVQLDPELYKAFEGLDPPSKEVLATALRLSANLVRITATGLNPRFGLLTNVMRDFLEQKVSTSGTIKGVRARDIWVARRGIKDWQRGKNTPLANLYAEALAEGSFITRAQVETRLTIEKNLQDIAWQAADGNILIKSVKNPKRALRVLLDNYQNIAERAENGTRFAAWLKARELGYQPLERMAIARDASVDFLTVGRKMASLNRSYAFLNAGYRGAELMFRNVKNNPKSLLIQVAKYVVAPTLAVMAWNYIVDPEGYKQIDPKRRKDKWFIMIPGGGAIAFPKPHVFDALAYNIEAIGDAAMFGTEIDWADIATNYVQALNPIRSGGSLWETVVPTAGKPIAALASNTGWWGGKIHPDFPYGTAPSPKYQYFTTNPPEQVYLWWADILDGIGDITGQDWIKQSPADLKYVTEQYTGGIGRIAGSTLQTIENAVQGKVVLNQTPFADVFFTNAQKPGTDQQAMSEFYKLRDEAQTKANDVKFEAEQRLAPVVERLIKTKDKSEYEQLPDEDKKTVEKLVKRALDKQEKTDVRNKYPDFQRLIKGYFDKDPAILEEIATMKEQEPDKYADLETLVEELTP